ncbi:MAG: hypothetical protein ACM3Q1_04100 [Bacteroidales bacterium]
MLTPPPRFWSPHARRASRPGPTVADPHLAGDRRHVVLVAAHRVAALPARPSWLRWLADGRQPARKVY